MESLLYEAKPYILLGMGGGAEIMHIHSNLGLLSAYLLGTLGGLILGMRVTARRTGRQVLFPDRREGIQNSRWLI